MKFKVALLTLCLMASSYTAQAATYNLDTDHTTVSFKIKHIFTKVQGHFQKFDGSFEYSEVQAILMQVSQNHSLNIYPNPSHGTFTLSLHNPNLERALIKLFDSTGNMIWSENFRLADVQEYWEQSFNLPQREIRWRLMKGILLIDVAGISRFLCAVLVVT